jgi:hypothetical protein
LSFSSSSAEREVSLVARERPGGFGFEDKILSGSASVIDPYFREGAPLVGALAADCVLLESGDRPETKYFENCDRYIPIDRNRRSDREDRMTLAEYEQFSELAEQMMHRCEPREAEYWRGYHRGINYSFRGKSDDSSQDHFTLVNLVSHGCNDPYMAAYAHGYHDGFTGKEPRPTVSCCKETPGN